MNERPTVMNPSFEENEVIMDKKFLTFKLADEIYGIKILKVQEIIGLIKITRVPRTPKIIRGVINLRGKVIPVIDLRERFDLPKIKDLEGMCTIVVQVQNDFQEFIMGILVDEVFEVVNIHDDEFQVLPEMDTKIDTSFILGMGKVDAKVITLLDIDKVLINH